MQIGAQKHYINMLVTSIVYDYGVKKEKHFQKDTNMKIHIFIPFKNIFKLKIYLGRMRQLGS
jgi:hypothetical protein